MLTKVVKVLGMIIPLSAAISAYLMLFGVMYTGATTESSTPQISTTLTVNALELALKHGSKVVIFWTIFWPIAIFLVSCIAAIAIWKRINILVWVIACGLLIVSILGIMTIGRFVVPIAILLLMSAVILLIEKYEIF